MAGTTDNRSPQMMATHAFEVGLRAIRDKHLARRKREQEATQEATGQAEAVEAYNVLSETYKGEEAQNERKI